MTALKQEVSRLTGIYPDFYVMVEWEAIGELVDALGGVYFDVPFDMNYDDPYQDLHIHQEAGYRKLSGEDAMEVIRWRKNNGEPSPGDVGRIQIQQDFLSAMRLEDPAAAPSPFTIATGTAAAPFLRGLLEQAKAYFPRLEGQVIAVENDFFGHTIDVAGLLTGQDLSAQLQRVPSLGRVLLPLHMLRHGETVFLDDYTVARLADELGCPVQIVGIDGGDLLDAMLDASSTVS